MNEISLKAPAKINLFLDITGKLPNGYHEIASVMQTVDLFDYVKIEKSENISAPESRSLDRFLKYYIPFVLGVAAAVEYIGSIILHNVI